MKSKGGQVDAERDVQSQIRDDLPVHVRGLRVFYNDVGVAKYRDDAGKLHVVSYGLTPGSHDLIGWTPYDIQESDVGRRVAIFTSLEVKKPKEQLRKNQRAWRDAVRKAGGISGRVTSLNDAVSLVLRALHSGPGP